MIIGPLSECPIYPFLHSVPSSAPSLRCRSSQAPSLSQVPRHLTPLPHQSLSARHPAPTPLSVVSRPSSPLSECPAIRPPLSLHIVPPSNPLSPYSRHPTPPLFIVSRHRPPSLSAPPSSPLSPCCPAIRLPPLLSHVIRPPLSECRHQEASLHIVPSSPAPPQ